MHWHRVQCLASELSDSFVNIGNHYLCLPVLNLLESFGEDRFLGDRSVKQQPGVWHPGRSLALHCFEFGDVSSCTNYMSRSFLYFSVLSFLHQRRLACVLDVFKGKPGQPLPLRTFRWPKALQSVQHSPFYIVQVTICSRNLHAST